MHRKKILERRIARLNKKREDLKARALASNDAAEVRSINDQLAELADEIADAQDEYNAIVAEEQEQRSAQPPAGAQQVNGAFGGGSFAQPAGHEQRDEDPRATMEYRQAFRQYVISGTPMQVRNGDAISTATTAPVIPTTVMRQIINTLRESYGNLYARVRKTSVPGGVEYPIGSLSASFKWINEGEVSPRQKAGSLAKVSFGYHTAEIRIAQTFLANLVTMEAFETELSKVIALAYVKAMDTGIVKGSGNGQMLGILNDARVTNYVTMTAAQMGNWVEWRKRFFAKLSLGYQSGSFIFPLSTVETYFSTMADSNNNPIFKQAADFSANPNVASGTFFGRAIDLVEPDLIKDFDTASGGDVIGIYWQADQYAINENFGITVRRYFDEETNEWVDKAIVVVDGKVLDPNGYYLIKKAT